MLNKVLDPKLEKEIPEIEIIYKEKTNPIQSPTIYSDELPKSDPLYKRKVGRPRKNPLVTINEPTSINKQSDQIDNLNVPQNSGLSGLNVGQKKPRYDETSQPNPLKCKFSPYSYHRFTRSHKEKMRDGSVIMVLRCRYCIEFQQVIIRWVLKDGKYIATKQTEPVKEHNET